MASDNRKGSAPDLRTCPYVLEGDVECSVSVHHRLHFGPAAQNDQ